MLGSQEREDGNSDRGRLKSKGREAEEQGQGGQRWGEKD